MGFIDKLRMRYDIYKLEQKYTRREKRSTFVSGAQYVNGEYVYNSPTASNKSASSFGSGAKRDFGSKRQSRLFS